MLSPQRTTKQLNVHVRVHGQAQKTHLKKKKHTQKEASMTVKDNRNWATSCQTAHTNTSTGSNAHLSHRTWQQLVVIPFQTCGTSQHAAHSGECCSWEPASTTSTVYNIKSQTPSCILLHFSWTCCHTSESSERWELYGDIRSTRNESTCCDCSRTTLLNPER